MSMGSRQVAVTTLLVSLVTAGLLTGCGSHAATPSAAGASGSPGSSVAPSSSAPPVATASPSAGGSPVPSAPAGSGSTGGPVPAPTGGPSAAGDLTLQGQVETGAEPSCLMLRSGGHLYNLLNGDTSVVRAGNNVVVQGHVVKGVMSHCMQGMPFLVTHARAA